VGHTASARATQIEPLVGLLDQLAKLPIVSHKVLAVRAGGRSGLGLAGPPKSHTGPVSAALAGRVLQRTDIGRVVGGLRKHPHTRVSDAARALVTEWKKLVPPAAGTPTASRAASAGPATPKETPSRPGSAAPTPSSSSQDPPSSQGATTTTTTSATPAPTEKPVSANSKKVAEAVKANGAAEPTRSKTTIMLAEALLTGSEDDDRTPVAPALGWLHWIR